MIVLENQIAGDGFRLRSGRSRDRVKGARALYLFCLVAYAAIGCSESRHPDQSFAEPELCLPDEVRVAVAPALNQSGSVDFDPVKVGDLMASELSCLEGVNVVGVSRVLAVLAEQGYVQIQSPEHALSVSERLGVDAILVFAITEYDAYTPTVGMAAQVYGSWRPAAGWDPVAASRAARPFPVPEAFGGIRPQAQAQRTFNASHDAVQRDVQRYAHSRSADAGPLGWKLYTASQEHYVRYCCFTVARELMSQRVENQAAASVAAAGETGR